ncbi:hypothetical protein KIN20_021425, partial [Parelaphostrongylus tenuis]
STLTALTISEFCGIPERLRNRLACSVIAVAFSPFSSKHLPKLLEHETCYARGQLNFSTCFVVAKESTIGCMYEPIVQKLANYLVSIILYRGYSDISAFSACNEVYEGACGAMGQKCFEHTTINDSRLFDPAFTDRQASISPRLANRYHTCLKDNSFELIVSVGHREPLYGPDINQSRQTMLDEDKCMTLPS